jgi:hypothetical protein
MNQGNISIFSMADFSETDQVLFESASDFSYYVQKKALSEGVTCTDIILEYCSLRDLEPEEISKLVNRSLREKILLEMQEEGLLPKTTELPFE